MTLTRKIDFSVFASANRRLFIFYFLFLLLYFINFNRGQQYFVYGLLLLSGLSALWANRRAFLLSAPLMWASALLLYLTASFIWSDAKEPTLFLEILCKAVLTWSFLLITCYFVWKKPQEFSKVLALMIVCVALLGLLSLILFYAQNPFPETRLVSFGQLTNANYMGSVNGLFAVVACHFALAANSTRRRFTYTLIFIVLSSVVTLTQSRGAFIAMLAAVGVLVLWQQRNRSVQYSIAVSILAGGYLFGKPLLSRLLTPGTDISADFRQHIWHDALTQINSHPFFGAGIGTEFQFATPGGLFEHPHSVYLAVTMYGGIPALILLLGMLVVAYRECIVEGRQRQFYLPLALLVYSTLCVLVDYSDVITFPRDIWIQFWFAIAVAGGLAINRKHYNQRIAPQW